jgi:SAM-dependent methyltransferase
LLKLKERLDLKSALVYSVREIARKILPSKPYDALLDLLVAVEGKVDDYPLYQNAVANKRGLEVGGPSRLFRTRLPLYQVAASVDFANFRSETVWEGMLASSTAYYKGKSGRQYVLEATDLSGIDDDQYDFVLSSNCIEHIANPLKALFEWKRVSKSYLVLVAPRKDNNFDHQRSVTSFEHILKDLDDDTDERDLTHLDEILECHDLSRDPALAGDFEKFKERSLDNFSNRCLHHHVFDEKLLAMILEYVGFQIESSTCTNQDWIFLARKKDAV